MLNDLGRITHLRWEPHLPVEINGRWACDFKVDAGYHLPDGTQVWEDVKAKGAPLSRDWNRIRKVVELLYGLKITIHER